MGLQMKQEAKDIRQEKDKLEIIKWVATLKDESAIARLKMLMNTSLQADWWELISEEEKAAIDNGLVDSKAERLRSHAAVKEALENLQLVKKGLLKARPAQELLDEL